MTTLNSVFLFCDHDDDDADDDDADDDDDDGDDDDDDDDHHHHHHHHHYHHHLIKGTIRDFLQSPHCTAIYFQHVRSSGPGAIVHKSRVAHRALITYNMLCYDQRGTVGQLCSKVWQSLHRIYFSFILLAEPLTDEGREETGVSGENPQRRASENVTYYSPQIQDQTETRTRTLALVTG